MSRWNDIPIHKDATLRDALGRGLHLMQDFDGPRFRWSDAADPEPRNVPCLDETSREAWRRLADRMFHEIGPLCGFLISTGTK